MLAHRFRRWPSIKPTLAQHLVFAGKLGFSGSIGGIGDLYKFSQRDEQEIFEGMRVS